jgi:hypothetical protein
MLSLVLIDNFLFVLCSLTFIKDCLPGSNVASSASDQNLMMTVIALIDSNTPREISLKFSSREERNSVLDKLR